MSDLIFHCHRPGSKYFKGAECRVLSGGVIVTEIGGTVTANVILIDYWQWRSRGSEREGRAAEGEKKDGGNSGKNYRRLEGEMETEIGAWRKVFVKWLTMKAHNKVSSYSE